MSSSIKVVVTGAAGQIAYSLIPRLVNGRTFGDKKVDLALVEIPQVVEKLKGLVMELEDSYFPHMGKVTYTDDFSDAAKDADCSWCIEIPCKFSLAATASERNNAPLPVTIKICLEPFLYSSCII